MPIRTLRVSFSEDLFIVVSVRWADVMMIIFQVDDTGTKATEDRLHQINQGLENGDENPEDQKEDPSQDAAVPINENLFLDEDLDEELQNLDLED